VEYDYLYLPQVFKAMVAPATMSEVNRLCATAVAAGQVASATTASTSGSRTAAAKSSAATSQKSAVLAFF